MNRRKNRSMKVTRINNTTLITEGYRKRNVALAIGVGAFLSAGVWINYLEGNWFKTTLMIFGLIICAVFAWRFLQNWQLIFERDINKAAFYPGGIEKSQSPSHFKVSDVVQASLHKEMVPRPNRAFSKAEVPIFRVALEVANQSTPLLIGPGTERDTQLTVGCINRWIARDSR